MAGSECLRNARRALAAFIVLGALSAHGQAEMLDIDPSHPPAPLLAPEELDRIQTLQSVARFRLLSAPRPDGAWILGGASFPGAPSPCLFLNPADLQVVPAATVAGATGPVSPCGSPSWWLDDGSLALFVPGNSPDGGSGQWLARLDPASGQVIAADVFLPVPHDILALSADGRFLVYMVPAAEGGFAADERPVRTERLRRGLAGNPGMDPAGEGGFVEVLAEPARLLLADRLSGELRTLTEVAAGHAVPAAAFSPTGDRLAVLLNALGVRYDRKPDGSWFRVPSLATIEMQDALGQLPLTTNPLYQASRLLVFNPAAPATPPRELRAPQLAGEPARLHSLAWNPTGDRLLTLAAEAATLAGRSHPAFYKPQAWRWQVFDRDLNPGAVFPAVTGSMGGNDEVMVNWLSDRELVSASVKGLDFALTLHHSETGASQALEERGGGYILSMAPIPGSRSLLLVKGSAAEPWELWRFDVDGQGPTQLTQVNRAAREAAAVAVRAVSFTLASGAERQGYWFAPAGMAWPPQEQRVVLWQNGGPGAAMVNVWGDRVEMPLTLLPTLGLSVLMVPLQQRPGWGVADWNALADGDHFGYVDIDELAEIAGQIEGRGWARADQIGISGCSYGGYMSAQSIVRHPRRYAAANPQCSLLDLATEFQSGEQSAYIAFLMGGSPWSLGAQYLADTPGYHGRGVITPTLVFHGTDDFLPIAIAENFYQDIENAGTPSRMLRFLGDGHGLGLPTNQFYAAQEQLQWFRRYLAP